jgi:hypothetical protein
MVEKLVTKSCLEAPTKPVRKRVSSIKPSPENLALYEPVTRTRKCKVLSQMVLHQGLGLRIAPASFMREGSQ